MSKPLRVLIVEDSPEDTELMRLELVRGGFEPSWKQIENAADMAAALAESAWDVILSDFTVPGFGAAEALDLLTQTGLHVPLIVVSGTIGDELAVELVRSGASDYIFKHNLKRLAPAVERELREAQHRRARRRAEEAADQLAAVVQSSVDPIVTESLDGVVTSWNPAAELLYGRTADDVMGGPIPFQVPSERVAELADAVERVRRGERVEPFETVHLHKDGTRIDVSMTLAPVTDRNSRLVGMSTSVRDITAKKRAQTSLVQAALLLANVHDSVIVSDIAGIVTYWNEGATRLFGWTSAEMMGKPLIERFPEKVRPRVAELTRGIMEGNDRVGEFEDYRKDGSRVWMDARICRISDAAGQPIGVMGVAHDITARKRAEMERDHALLQLRLQIERMPLAYILFDADLRVIDWNAAAERIFGYSRAEVLGMEPPYAKIVPQTARQQTGAILGRLRSGDMAAHGINDNLTKDGRTIVCEWSNTPLLDADGVFVGLVSLAQDVSERIRAEEALRVSEERLRQVAENISEVFWLTNPAKNEIVYLSAGYEKIWGRSCQSVYDLPQNWLDAIHIDDRARVTTAAVTKQATGEYDEEYRIVRPDGSCRWIRDRAFPVLDANQQVIRIAGVAEDITERRDLEAQLRQSQKMDAIGQLAGGVAHDFNNLLTIITGYSTMLLQSPDADDLQREMLEEIKKAGERSASLTSQLLAFSRKQVLAPKVLALNDVVRNIERMLQRVIGEDIQLATVLESRLDSVKADPGQIEQVILNLAVNARDAMPQGGKVIIETRNVELDEGYARTHTGARSGSFVVLTVTDSGTGMTEEVKPHVFEPFFTTKGPGQGTGLGLAVVHGFITQSDGHIEIESEAGIGTSVRIYLPRVDPLVASEEAVVDPKSVPAGTETILVVEDEEGVRALILRVLQTGGYHVLAAGHGDEALQIAANHHGPIDLLMTDVVMPGVGGRELAERLLASHADLKVLYLSGYTDDAVMRHGIMEDEVNFLQKPFSPKTLVRKVHSVLTS